MGEDFRERMFLKANLFSVTLTVALILTLTELSLTDDLAEHEDLEAVLNEHMTESLCEEPLPPMSGEMQCGRHKKIPNRFVCKAECDEGFQFPNGKPKRKHMCDMDTGKWTPEFVFPDCEPICEPPCQNDGKCTEENHCVCLPGYRGNRCQYSHDLCSPTEALDVTADWKCNHTSSETLCVLQCPQGTQFERQPADLYRCSLDGVWTPDSAPKCLPINIIEPPSSHGMFPISTGQSAQTVSSDVCVAWGQSHYRTFDGGMFSFDGQCTYLLAKDCSDNTFAIHINNAGPCESPSSCHVSVNIYVGKEEFVLMDSPEGPVVTYQEETHFVPTAIAGMLFQPVSDYVSLTSPLGFRLKWNRRGTVLLKMGNQMKNKTCGLCGRFDGSVLNDFGMADGSITDNVEAFVNSWTMNRLDGQCPKGAVVAHRCNSVERIHAEGATAACGKMSDPRFSACHELVDPRPYYEACRMDYCSCSQPDESCICNSLEEYFRECVRLGGNVEGGWRSEDLCPRNCPAGMVYEDCGTFCPMTCKNTVYGCEDEHCVDGCHCPEGTVLHKNQCLPKTQCPCIHNGKEYETGARITQECNACECLGGKWTCTSEKCEARCSSVGDPHYTTFDGTKYEFLGSCPYYLVYHDNFTIVQENGPCPVSAESPVENSAEVEFCTQAIRLSYEGSTLVLKPNTEPVFEETTVTSYPFTEKGVTIDLASSMFVKVDLSNGLSMLWDGKNRLYIDAPPSLYGQTQGLCGTFNHNQNDDFITPEGDMEADVSVFASRWKASDSCHKRSRRMAELPPCGLQEQKLPDAMHLCSFLKSEIFGECNNEVDPDPFYRNCMSDLCVCTQDLEKCLCDSFSDYGAACARKGVVVNWAQKVAACMPRCENGQIYQECGNPCKSSCLTISGSQDCQEKCVQGCACPDGMTQNAERFCIPIDQCPCVYEGKEYTANSPKLQGTSMCECQNAVWNCRSARLEELIGLGNDMMVLDKSLTCDESNHEEFTQCMPACKTTCQNLRLPNDCLTLGCKPGCICKDGYVLDEDLNRCVRISECGCRHGRRKYAERSRIQKDCNLCICENGSWKCTEKACPGICTAWGESHFKTFDGRIFDFHGDCEYTLVQGTLDFIEFSLSVRNVPCGTSGVTCSKSFTLDLGNDEKIVLSRDDPLPSRGIHGPRILAYEVGLFISVYTDIGITLRWDKGTRMYINVDPRWRGKLVGLCGNFNDDQSDDFLSPFGGLPESRPTLFADSWKIQETCPASRTIDDACSLHPDREGWARQKCAVMKSDLFAPCHSEVAVGPFFERCVFDSCACDIGGDCECLCTAIAAYAQECNVQGVHITWRTQELCPIQCEECATYESCMPPCPLKTCETQLVYEDIDYCADESCIEGCKPKPCSSGQIFNNAQDLQCIPEVECVVPCKEINGRMYNEGERVTDTEVVDACQSCHCLRGAITCTGQPCPTTTPSPITIPPVECQETGWTPWMNTPRTLGGDYENVKSFSLFVAYSKYCGPYNVTDIECRVAESKTPYKESGQNVLCDLPEGLICKDELQNSELCEDYEIRLFCDCGPVTVSSTPTTTIPQKPPEPRVLPMCVVPGWTYWMNTHELNANGDFETLESIRNTRLLCPDDEIEDIECRSAITRRPYDINDPNVRCDKNFGLQCLSSENYQCDDYEIRFYCRCQFTECDYPRGMKNGYITASQIVVTSYSSEDHDGDKGRVNGLSAWRSGTLDLPQWIQVDLEEVQEITGVYTQGNPLEDEWVTAFKMSYSNDGEEFTDVTDSDGNIKILPGNSNRNTPVYSQVTPFFAKYVRLSPVEWHNWISLRFELLGCNRKPGCEYPRGMENGFIKDSQISVSSFWTEDTGAGSARLNGDSSWRTGNIEFQQWIQVDLEAEEEIAGIVTQGSPVTDEWITFYKVSYSSDGVQFSFVKDSDGNNRIFVGNEDRNTIEENMFSPVFARYVRIIPVEWHNWISLRFEILGCNVIEEVPTTPTTPTTTTQFSTMREFIFSSTTTLPPTTTTEVITTVSPCPAGEVYDSCAYQCEHTCMSFLSILHIRMECIEKDCVEGCRPPHKCTPPYLWRDFATCVPREECSCVMEDGTIVAPNEVVQSECEKCQCVNNSLTCFNVPLCGTTQTPKPHILEVVNIENPNCWTDWVNIDSPYQGSGDMEVLPKIRERYEFCQNPVEIECRKADNKQKASDTGQNVECDLRKGLRCFNSQNGENGCYDYEIRFFCPCPGTTTPPPTPLPPSLAPPAPCDFPGWTQWFNEHVPNEYEEYESVQSIRAAGGYFCSSDMITAVECQKSEEGPERHLLQHGVLCDLEHGLICKNSDLILQPMCKDYEIRFFCDCPTSPQPVTTTPIQTTTPPVYIPPFIEISTPAILPCAQWSQWINDKHPEGSGAKEPGKKGTKKGKITGDIEKRTLLRFQQQEKFCLEGQLTAIECRDAETDVDYSETGDLKLICNLKSGFRCRGKDQPDQVCRDYKIRYFCSCLEESSTVRIITTPPPTTPPVPPCSTYYYAVDGPFPLPDSNLRASSSKDPSSGPQSARLSSVQSLRSSGAWIAEKLDSSQYLEIDLGQIQPVYGVVTKGRDGEDEWVKSYYVLFSRDGISFSYMHEEPDFKTKKVFPGNYDSDSLVKHVFTSPFEARYVRIQPITFMREIALRADVLGCAEGISTPTPITTTIKPICEDEMGLENGNISDSQITASSSRGTTSGPSFIRLHTMQTENHSGGWVADVLDENQYVEIDFLEPRTVTGFITQGRELVPQWVTSYKVLYSQDGSDWNILTDEEGNPKVFPGNFDSETTVKNFLPQPIRARFIRINPLTWNNWIAMRLEVLGCFEPYPVITTTAEACTVYQKLQRVACEIYGSSFNTFDGYSYGYEICDHILTKGVEDAVFSVKVHKECMGKYGTCERYIVINVDGDNIRIGPQLDELYGNKVPFQNLWLLENSFPTLKFNKTKDQVIVTSEKYDFSVSLDTQQNIKILISACPSYEVVGLCGNYNGDVSDDQQRPDGSIAVSSEEFGDSWSISDMRRCVRGECLPDFMAEAVEICHQLKEPPLSTCSSYMKTSVFVTDCIDFICECLSNASFTNEEHSCRCDAYQLFVEQCEIISNQPITGWQVLLGCAEEIKGITTETPPPQIFEGCTEPMGLESFTMPDSSILVSSSASMETDGSRIRLNTHLDEYGAGGWVASSMDYNPSVNIDFFGIRNITGIVTQGRQDADMWVTLYTVQYSIDGFEWIYCEDSQTKSINFSGNHDRSTYSKHDFTEMVEAQFMKVSILDFHEAPAMRMELFGCFEPYVAITVPPYWVTTAEYCIEYGPWISLSHPTAVTDDEEPINEVIEASGLCDNPLRIQCRTVTTKKDYTKTGQNVICDLTQGLICRNMEQSSGYCQNYEVRIGCWSCVPPTTTTVAPVILCPETPISMQERCLPCAYDHACNGTSCVPFTDCPCFQEGKRFNPGDRMITSECSICDCMIEGHSVCKPMTCPSCLEGQKSELTKDCKCICTGCPVGTQLCPTNGQCVELELWCNGIIDCPDDEVGCPTTTTTQATTTTVTPAPVCTPEMESETVSCEMAVNLFNTFDELEYQYEICDHVLVKDMEELAFVVTVHKECPADQPTCSRYVTMDVDDVEIRLGTGAEDLYINDQQIPMQNLWLVTKRFPDFVFMKEGSNLVVKSLKYGFEVMWDSRQIVRVTMSKCNTRQVFGLCGFYNHNMHDDRLKPDGELAPNIQEFGDSWSIGDPHRCVRPKCPVTTMTIAYEVCRNLLLQPPFTNCSEYMNVVSSTEVCREYMCECMLQKSGETENDLESTLSCMCEAYGSFVETCERISNERLPEWRVELGCVPKCPPDMEWHECGQGCELTCDNYRTSDEICSEQCVPGCYCPAGLVRHRDRCVPPKMCQDCVCRGHGDPNYISFDGHYYAFQGNCTYVLAQHQTGSHLDFQVLATNVECPEEPHTSCTAGVKVIWNGHTVVKFKNEPIYLDGRKLKKEELPYEDESFSISYVPRKSAIIHVKDINLVVRYIDQLYGYNIELPSYVYFNKTEGLCGICNFNESDDMYHRDGYITDDVDDFAYSWLVGNTRDECTLPRVPVPPPEPKICNFTRNRCEVFLDPDFYSKACLNDISYSTNAMASMCRSKVQYAQQCCERGVSLHEWLHESGCSFSCEEGMLLECTSSCQKTCDNYKEYDPRECSLSPLLTCSCPPDKVFKFGKCIEPETCEICDDEGHVVGDKWDKGPCESCVCLENRIIRCKEIMCPQEPICSEEEELEILPHHPGACCAVYQCRPKPEKSNCTEVPQIPICEPGQAVKTSEEYGCVVYKCECDEKLCPPVVRPTSVEEAEEYVLIKEGCCSQYKSQCFPEKCKGPIKCAPGFKLSTFDGKCCTQSTCVPKKNVCVYNHKHEVVNGTDFPLVPEQYYDKEYEVGSSWKDGLCRRCTCVESDGLLSYKCSIEICPDATQLPDAESYIRELEHIPGMCCPKYRRVQCVHGGNVYSADDEWPSPDGDKCKSYRCIETRNGEVIRMEKTVVCDNQNCPVYAEYVEPEPDSPRCCGYCKPVACEENGVVHEGGSTWQSETKPCYTAECIVTENMTQVIYRGERCPAFPSNCPPENTVLDSKGCCKICERKPEALELCRPQAIPVEETVGHFLIADKTHGICTNSRGLKDLARCSGECASELKYFSEMDDFENTCKCCLPSSTVHREIALDCDDGYRITKVYQQPSACHCTSCTGSGQPGFAVPPAY